VDKSKPSPLKHDRNNMKLYNVYSSPYCGRVRYFVYASVLPVEIVQAPANQKDPAFLAVSPLGLVPALVLDSGQSLIESEIIIESLADLCKPPVFKHILPSTPLARARSRLVSRVVDLYLGPHTAVLYNFRMAPADQAVALKSIHKVFDQLEALKPDPYFSTESRLAPGDLAVGLAVVHAEHMGKQRLGLAVLEGRPALRAWYDRLLRDPDFAKVRQENMDALDKLFAAAYAKFNAAKTKL